MKEFFAKKMDPSKQVLLAYSGGPDSTFLLHRCLQAGVKPALAHVDHGWRKESSQEASWLQKQARERGLEFHLLKLSEESVGKEDLCRKLRLEFFEQLCQEHGYQAVLLGHHLDDLAETVLKRLLEGSSLRHMLAMKEEGYYRSMRLWRPLLGVRKKEILEELKRLGLPFIHDPTNEDASYLRGRMRTAILPHLTKNFGKEVAPPLVRLAEELDEINQYLDEKTGPVEEGLEGIDFREIKNFLERRHLLRRIAASKKVALSYAMLQQLMQLIEKGGRGVVKNKEASWRVERGIVFIDTFEEEEVY